MTSADRTAAERQRRRRHQQRAAAELSFVRQDWALFLQPDRLAQKAGCAQRHLRRMTVKELADNAADAGSPVTAEQLDDSTVRVVDQGSGLGRDRVPELFAIDRPMTSSKLLRRPTHGAVGNGSRVVTGAVLGSGGVLTVESLGRRYRLEVDRRTGETRIVAESDSGVTQGTAVTVRFGPGLPVDPDVLAWARAAAALAGPAARPMRSRPGWYGEGAWRELVEAAAGHTAAELLASGSGVEADDDRPAASLTLREARHLAAAVPEPRLLPIPVDAFAGAHAQVQQDRVLGVPVLVQAWATASRVPPRAQGRLEIDLVLNRTTGPAKLEGYFEDRKPIIQGCQLHYSLEGRPAGYWLTIAVTAPYLPMVTDGKEPDLGRLADPICAAAMAAMRKAYAKAKQPAAAKLTILEAAFAGMADAYRMASAQGTLPANARQVYYAARPAILALTGRDKLDSNYFTQGILPRYLDEHPEETAAWDIVHDARGHLTEPHTGHVVALGTLDVRGYLAPRRAEQGPLVRLDGGGWAGATTDRYRTALFIEKEGFEPLIAAARIRERFDAAVLSTKGMSTTAARALVERLSRDGVRILVAHDLDRAGKSILGTLAKDTPRYAYAVAPNIVDLGLTLAQCRAMGLQDEEDPLPANADRAKVRARLRGHGATAGETAFLADRQRRVELNAMTAGVFVRWLEAGLVRHGAGKVVPGPAALAAAWRRATARQRIAADARRLEAKAAAIAAGTGVPADLAARVRREIEGTGLPWDEGVRRILSRSPGDGRASPACSARP